MPFTQFECPAALAARGLSLRPETPDDVTALRRVYFDHRRAEFAALPLAEAQLAMLLDSQFDLQRGHYRQEYQGAMFLALAAGEDVIGRLYLAETTGSVVILDILLRADRRGQGIGGALIADLLTQARAQGLGAVLQVDKGSAAQRLYRRLGFTISGDSDFTWEMGIKPGSPASS